MSQIPEHLRELCPACGLEQIKSRGAKICGRCNRNPDWFRSADAHPQAAVAAGLCDDVGTALRKSALTLEDLAAQFDVTPGQALDAVLTLRGNGVLVTQHGEAWEINARGPSAVQQGRVIEYTSQPDGSYVFGISTDKHIGSKYARLDVIRDTYQWFADEGADRVFDCGNWIDGESRFNKYDLSVIGLEPQIEALIAAVPRHDSLTTYAIHGDDHEGWYGQREAIDIGRFCESKFRDAGREDWVDLGFMEARIDLVHAETGARTSMLVMHPGGGSSYAVSYRPQKIVEALPVAEQPALLCIGHYHKMSVNYFKGTWCVQGGCAQDQTPFARKKGLDFHVGSVLVRVRQDAETGALVGCQTEMRSWGVVDYTNHRWTKTGAANLPPRTPR